MNEIITVLSSDVSILSSIAVSRLMPVYDTQGLSLSADQYKLLVSEPCEDTSTKHISKYVPFGDMINVIRDQFDIDGINEKISELSTTKGDRREYELGDKGGWVKTTIEKNPFIISSIYETNEGNISVLDGYDLSLGMNEAFKYSLFDIIKTKELSSKSISSETIESLSIRTSTLSSKTISSETINTLSIESKYISGDTIYCTNISSENLSTLISSFVETTISDDYIGSNGEVRYVSPSGKIDQTILNNLIYICDNNTDLEKCVNSNISFKDIYNTWKMGGRVVVQPNNTPKWYGFTDYPLSGSIQGDDMGYKYWYYDVDYDTIVQPNNTSDDTFFYSGSKYTDYDITLRCYSTNTDDDWIGFVLAFIEDSPTGTPQFLVAYRSPQNTKGSLANDKHWFIYNSYIKGFPTFIEVKNPENEYIPPELHGWKELGAGTLIHTRRTGSTITVETTPFEKDISREDLLTRSFTSKITLDLTQICGGLFNQPASIGYIAKSQAYTMYENINFNVEKIVVDTRTKALSVYNPISREWTSESIGVDTLETCGYGRFIKNPLTEKVFYTTQTGFDSFIKYSDLQEYENRIQKLEEFVNQLKNQTLLKLNI